MISNLETKGTPTNHTFNIATYEYQTSTDEENIVIKLYFSILCKSNRRQTETRRWPHSTICSPYLLRENVSDFHFKLCYFYTFRRYWITYTMAILWIRIFVNFSVYQFEFNICCEHWIKVWKLLVLSWSLSRDFKLNLCVFTRNEHLLNFPDSIISLRNNENEKIIEVSD